MTSSCSDDASNPGDTADTGKEIDDAEVSYHRDVRPILEANCVQCHTPDGVTPFPLTSFEEVHPVRDVVAWAVRERIMPPFLPAPDCADYSEAARLSEQEVETIQQWVELGAHEGNPDDYVSPEVPDLPELSRVDARLEMKLPYTPQQRPDDYRCFLLDWPETETTFVSGFRAVPGQLSEVHHVIAYYVAPTDAERFQGYDDDEEGPGYTCFGGAGGAVSLSSGRWLGAWAPGGLGVDYPEGTGLRMEPGSKVVLQVHYNTAVQEPIPDATAIEFKVERTVEREAYVLLWLDVDWVASGTMRIPAGEADVIHAYQRDPTQIMSFYTDVIPEYSPFVIHFGAHHMHELGTRAVQAIRHGDGTDECLVEIPRWDFNWQTGYRYQQPRLVEPGDDLYIECHWDNSAGTEDVGWGDGTSDEMCLGVFYITEP